MRDLMEHLGVTIAGRRARGLGQAARPERVFGQVVRPMPAETI